MEISIATLIGQLSILLILLTLLAGIIVLVFTLPASVKRISLKLEDISLWYRLKATRELLELGVIDDDQAKRYASAIKQRLEVD